MRLRQDKKRIALEARRKLSHFIVGSILTVLLYFDIIPLHSVALIALVGLGVSLIHTRWSFLNSILRRVEREDSPLPGWGAITLVVGIYLSFLLFPLPIALLAASALTIVDAVSSSIGVLMEKSGAKSAAAALIGALTHVAIMSSLFTELRIMSILIAAGTAGLVEAVFERRGYLDDNLVIPLAVGAVLMLVEFLG